MEGISLSFLLPKHHTLILLLTQLPKQHILQGSTTTCQLRYDSISLLEVTPDAFHVITELKSQRLELWILKILETHHC